MLTTTCRDFLAKTKKKKNLILQVLNAVGDLLG